MKDNLLKSGTHGMLWLGSSQAFLILIRLLVLIILARWITPEEFGLAGLVLLIVVFSDMVAGLGIVQAMVQRKNLNDQHISAGFAIVFLLSLVFAGALYLASPAISRYAEQDSLGPLLQIAVLIFPINACLVIPKALLQRKLMFKQLAASEVIAFSMGYGLVGVVMALLGFGAVTLLAASIARSFLSACLLWWFAPKFRFSIPGREACQDLLKVGPGFGIAQIGNYLARNSDRFVVFHTFGPAAMGIYDRAFMLSQYPEKFLGQTMDHVLFPIMSNCQDDLERVKRAFCRGCILFAGFSFPCTIPLIVASTEIVVVVLSPQWAPAGPVFRVLAFLLAIRFLNKLNECLTRAVGAVYRRAWRIWVHLLMILVFVWIGSIYGLVPVAIGVGVAAVLNFLLMTHLSLKLLKMSWLTYLRQFIRPGSAYVVTLVTAWVVAAIVREATGSNVLVIASSFVITVLFYTVMLLKNPSLILGAEADWILNALWNAVPTRLHHFKPIRRLLHQDPLASA